MHFRRYKYPSYSEPLLAAYQSAFNSAFVLLHPFREDAEQHHSRTPLTWAHVSGAVCSGNLAMLNRALLTSIGALRKEFSDPPACHVLDTFLTANALWEPVNGAFDLKALSPILDAAKALGFSEFVFVPDISDDRDPELLEAANLRKGELPLHFSGSLVARDESFLMTVDWDSFFTVLFGSTDLVSHLVAREVEGFFATSSTKHFWFDPAL